MANFQFVPILLEEICAKRTFSIFNFQKNRSENGQSLVLLLVLMVTAITITSAAVVATLVNSQSESQLDLANRTYDVTESGVENSLLRLLRDPNYTGEIISLGLGTAVSTVSGATTKTLTTEGRLGEFTRKIQVGVSYTNNVMIINSWKEVSP